MKDRWIPLLVMVLFLMLSDPSGTFAENFFYSGRAGFSVHCNQMMLGYHEQAVFALPGETLVLQVVDAKWRTEYFFDSEFGRTQKQTERKWVWTVPETPGNYTGRIFQLNGEEAVFIYCFVMVPFEALQGGDMNGYRIGQYPSQANGHSEIYPQPRGFIEVTEDNVDHRLMPHFTLRQFICRQDGAYPKYVVLDERLLIKLEVLLARVNLEGFACHTLSVSSGYRTPYYNQRLGNAKYSLHMWGRAADIFVDGNGDHKMDDLNRDGKNNMSDVRRLIAMVEQLDEEPRHHDKIGGLGLYDRTEKHGPFVHIDVRGERARWERKRAR